MQQQDIVHHQNVLRLWRAIETFTLPDVPAKKRDDGKEFMQLEPGCPLPWANEFADRSGDVYIKYTLYFHCVPKQQVLRALTTLTPDPSDEFMEPQPGTTCLAALVVNHYGQALERTYVRSAFVYGLQILQTGGDPETLDELLKKAFTEFLFRFQADKNSPRPIVAVVTGDPEELEDAPEPERAPESEDQKIVTWEMLEKELSDLAGIVGSMLTPTLSILCVSEETSPNAEPEAPFLNTFYLDSLNYLIGHPENMGIVMKSFLNPVVEEDKRADMQDPGVMLACLDPQNMSPGRWPANPEVGLYSAQLAALNFTLSSLRYNSGLIGINGPPGTGKTTLLREIIADVVVSRAKRLLNADVNRLFTNKRIAIAEYDGYYDIDVNILAGDGVLVASNNNSAVENISRELPTVNSIDMESFPDARYFENIARNLDKNSPCWGLMSAVLGSSKRKKDFVNDFWFAKGKGFDAFLKGQYNLHDKTPTIEHERVYNQIAGELKELLLAFETFQQTAVEYDALIAGVTTREISLEKCMGRLNELAGILENEHKIPRTNLPDIDFIGRPMTETHRHTPYCSEGLNKLRSKIFLKSLELIERAILVNAKYFRSNLNAFVDLLSGKIATLVKDPIAVTLWNTFFFCIPVVSTTLASLERLFSKLGCGSIGWLLLDEAGQATPQSVCGALWRAHRAIIIGDTRQIPPVVTIPDGLCKFLQRRYQVEDPYWSPLHSSAQLLADRVTYVGTHLNIPGGEVWTGVPLRAHRRCDDPMFTLSNQIAYDGQMVKVTGNTEVVATLPLSCWFDVKSNELVDGNVVFADIQTLGEIANRIKTDLGGEMFAISPFRSVADFCKKYFTDKKKIQKLSFGTIHTFQGKEAEAVFIVLGMARSNVGARIWASATPNLLNVAVTRAKKRVYVIGDYDLWSQHPYFEELAEALPRRVYQLQTLF